MATRELAGFLMQASQSVLNEENEFLGRVVYKNLGNFVIF